MTPAATAFPVDRRDETGAHPNRSRRSEPPRSGRAGRYSSAVPATRFERVLVFAGLVGAAGLVFLVFTASRDYRDSQPSTRLPSAPAAVAATTAEERAPVSRASVELTATRGASWLEVRAGSGRGESLFVDTLDRGDRERFSEERLWLRFGAAQNVDATLNGEPVDLPGGTTTVVVSPSGVRTVGAG